MRHLTEATCRIRLACVTHAASVRSEPGSNSPLALLPSLSRAAPATRLPLSCVGSSLLRTSSTQRTNTTSTHHCRTSHLSAHPRVSRLGSTPSLFFVKSFLQNFIFFLIASRDGTTRFLLNEELHPRAREGTLLACPRTLDKGSSPAHTCFCQALSTKFLLFRITMPANPLCSRRFAIQIFCRFIKTHAKHIFSKHLAFCFEFYDGLLMQMHVNLHLCRLHADNAGN